MKNRVVLLLSKTQLYWDFNKMFTKNLGKIRHPDVFWDRDIFEVLF